MKSSSESILNHFFICFIEGIEKRHEDDEGVFSESSEDDLIADDSPKLQRTNARRFGKVNLVPLLSLKCHFDQKINAYFSLDFKTMLTKH